MKLSMFNKSLVICLSILSFVVVGLAISVSCVRKDRVAVSNRNAVFEAPEYAPVIIYQTDKYTIYQKEVETDSYHGYVLWGEDKEGNLVSVAKN